MSPLMHVKKYSLQERVGKMLVIHGAADENDGTFPMQSERYFAALKAFGELFKSLCPHKAVLFSDSLSFLLRCNCRYRVSLGHFTTRKA